MRGTKKFASAIGLLVLLALGAGIPELATARGFCNIDGLGTKELQQEVTNAGATFFDGGTYLMAMLAALERGDGIKGKAVGSDAVKSFSSASGAYKSIAGKMSKSDNEKLAAVKVEIAAAIARASPSAPLFSETARIAQSQDGAINLMMHCGNESERMRAATAGFLETKQDQEKVFAVLLSEWNRTLFIGRTVSAFFAAAGGSN
jgi:hypothetical protein